MGGSAKDTLSYDKSHLGKHYDNGAGFGQAYSEMCIQIIDRPWNVDTGPALSYRPIRPEQPSAVNMLKMLEKILVRDPEYLEDNEPDLKSNKRL